VADNAWQRLQTALESLAEAIDAARPIQDEDEDSTLDSEMANLRHAVTTAQTVIDTSDEQLAVPTLWLDRVSEQAEAAKAEIEADQMPQAVSRFPAMLEALVPLSALVRPPKRARLAEEATAFARTTRDLMRDLTAESLTVRAQLDELRTQAQADVESRNEAVASFDQHHSEITGRLDEAVRRMDAAIGQFSEQFTAAQAERVERFGQELEEARTQLRAAGESLLQLGTQQQEIQKADAQEHLDRLSGILDKANEVYKVLGETVAAGHYGTVADEQKSAADHWRLVAVGAGALAVIAACVGLFLSSRFAPFDAEHTTLKFGVSLGLLALAGYCAQQSSDHRQRERIARELQVALATVDPYIATLDPPDQAEIRLALARRAFLGGTAIPHRVELAERPEESDDES
jgi:hypothetical protein